MDFTQQYKISLQFEPEKWKGLMHAIEMHHPITYFPNDIMSTENVKRDDYIKISEEHNTRIVFHRHTTIISAEDHTNPISFLATIQHISNVSPYVRTLIKTCKNCGKSYSKTFDSPINDHAKTAFIEKKCDSKICQFNRSKSWELEEKMVDCCKITVGHYNRTVQCFVQTNPRQGFEEVKNKLYTAFEMGIPIFIHGFLFVESIHTSHHYFVEIMDIDFSMSKQLPIRLIPFNIPYTPSNEKEMVMGIFFANITFMQKYLDFTDWSLQIGYPDLTIFNGDSIRHIEFEFDVANFYKHGHHKKEQQAIAKCDHIIAWKNTTHKTKYDPILIQDLVGKSIPDRYSHELPHFDPHTMFNALCEIVRSCFNHRTVESLYPIVFACMPHREIKSIFNQHHVIFTITNMTAKDKNALETLKKMVEYKKNAIKINKKPKEDEYNIDILLEDSNNMSKMNLEDIFHLKDYISTLRMVFKKLPPIRKDTGVINYILENSETIIHGDIIVMLSGIYASFMQKEKITTEDVDCVMHLLF